MGNLMSTLYIGYVKEIIRDTMGAPTFDLRVHVPAIHGFRVSDETKLPIARPLVIPGMTIIQEDLEAVYNDNLIGQRVIVFFESGNKTNPIYLGVVGIDNFKFCDRLFKPQWGQCMESSIRYRIYSLIAKFY